MIPTGEMRQLRMKQNHHMAPCRKTLTLFNFLLQALFCHMPKDFFLG